MVSATPLLLALLAANPSGPGGRGFSVGPAAAWVERAPLTLDAPSLPDTAGGVEYLLVEDQVRVTAGGVERHHRWAMRVLSPQGVDEAAEIRVEYDPSFERATLHEATVHRGGRRIDALRPREIRVLQRESELERQIYDGTLTAVQFLHDVRVGDVVECAFTITGQNPTLGGRFVEGLGLGYGVPVGRASVRLLWPTARPLAARVHGLELAPVRREQGAVTEYRWVRERVPRDPEEPEVPGSTDDHPWLQLSEFSGWDEVARWAAPLYEVPAGSREVARQVEPWRALPGEEARALAAIRFVQDEVRYLGIELGPHGHRPHAPADVLRRRFGDCKDKSLLLRELLRALDIPAEVALVSTSAREALDRRLPSPHVFDHAVVRMTVGGVTYWVDPTVTLERGALASRPGLPFRRALVVRPETRALTVLPTPAPSEFDVESTYRVAPFGAPVQLTVRTRQAGARATAIRQTLASRIRSEIQREWLDYYARIEPGTQVSAPFTVQDDEARNVVTVVERYELPPADSAARDLYPDAILGVARKPELATRTLPLAVRHPQHVHEVVRVLLPARPSLAYGREEVVGPAGRLVRALRWDGAGLVVDLDYRSTASAVAPADYRRHVAALDRMRELAEVTIPAEVEPPARRGPGSLGWAIAVAVIVAGLGVVFAAPLREGYQAFALARRRSRFARSFDTRPGESAATAIALAEGQAPLGVAARMACACGARFELGAVAALPGVVVAGRRVEVVAARCARCGAERRLHFETR